jgi:hypothetical protein
MKGSDPRALRAPAFAGLLVLLLLACFLCSCGHFDKPSRETGEEKSVSSVSGETPPEAALLQNWRPRLEEQNRQYVLDTLGAEGEDPWFLDIPRNEGAFYYIALSNKTAAEQRARTNAQNEARRLAREYYREVTGLEPDPRAGRGLEVIRWKTITGTADGGQRYYIACALIRLPEDWPGALETPQGEDE